MSEKEKPTCCYYNEQGRWGCDRDAIWYIAFGGGPDDYTESCTEHAGILMENTDSPFFTVTHIDV